MGMSKLVVWRSIADSWVQPLIFEGSIKPGGFLLEIQDYDGGDFQFEVLGSVGKPQNFGRWFPWIPIICCEMAVLF